MNRWTACSLNVVAAMRSGIGPLKYGRERKPYSGIRLPEALAITAGAGVQPALGLRVQELTTEVVGLRGVLTGSAPQFFFVASGGFNHLTRIPCPGLRTDSVLCRPLARLKALE